jgi:anti-anti-sigma regulatory factor
MNSILASEPSGQPGSQSGAQGVFVLPVELGGEQLAFLRKELLAVLSRSPSREDGATVAPIALDASGVEQVDSAGAQVLLAFVTDAGRAGRGVTWLASSARLTELAGVLGIAKSLFCGQSPPTRKP